jgi:hypothetical protein
VHGAIHPLVAADKNIGFFWKRREFIRQVQSDLREQGPCAIFPTESLSRFITQLSPPIIAFQPVNSNFLCVLLF